MDLLKYYHPDSRGSKQTEDQDYNFETVGHLVWAKIVYGESPRHFDDGFFSGPSETVNHGVLESLELFGAAGSAPAGYHGAAIGGTAAASTNVANNYYLRMKFEFKQRNLHFIVMKVSSHQTILVVM